MCGGGDIFAPLDDGWTGDVGHLWTREVTEMVVLLVSCHPEEAWIWSRLAF